MLYTTKQIFDNVIVILGLKQSDVYESSYMDQQEDVFLLEPAPLRMSTTGLGFVRGAPLAVSVVETKEQLRRLRNWAGSP